MRPSSAPPSPTSHLTRHGQAIRVYRAVLDEARDRATAGLPPLDADTAMITAQAALTWLAMVRITRLRLTYALPAPQPAQPRG